MDTNARYDAQDPSPFLKVRKQKEEAAAASQGDLAQVCEERGFLYRDPVKGITAKLMTVHYSPRCNECGKTIPNGSQALGVRPDAEGNRLKRWVFGCLECANASRFESARDLGGLFPKREEG
jgi:hypothetical protein